MSMALFAVMFVSCTNENVSIDPYQDAEQVVLSENHEGLETLCKEIQNYNYNHFKNTEYIPTRGKKWWRSFIKWFTVIGTDAVVGGCLTASGVGAAGAIPAGVAASGLAALAFDKKYITTDEDNGSLLRSMNNNPSGFSFVNPDSTVFTNIVPDGVNNGNGSVGVNQSDSVGYYHNKTLYNLFSDEATVKRLSKLSQKEQVNAILEELSKVDPSNNNIDDLNVQDVIDATNKMLEIANVATDEDDFFERLGNAGFADKNLVKVMKDILEGISQLDENTDDGTYYQNVLEIVDASDLNNAQKERLRNGAIIGQASNRLWSAELKHIDENLHITDPDPSLAE